MCSESFDFSVEGFSSGICTSVIEVIEDGLIVILSHQGNRFMYPIMKETWDQGKIHKVLQAFVDKRLEEEYEGNL